MFAIEFEKRRGQTLSHVKSPFLNRRLFLGASAACIAAPAVAQDGPDTVEYRGNISNSVRRNASSFRALDWQPYFSSTRSVYKLYPTSVPLSEDLTRRGRTKVTRKVEGPEWRPTPSMKKRNPEWPDYVGPGPDNPLGTHALYLSWTYYRIHGTHDTRKIGRRSSNGCIGLYNQHISELFALSTVGTQVLVI